MPVVTRYLHDAVNHALAIAKEFGAATIEWNGKQWDLALRPSGYPPTSRGNSYVVLIDTEDCGLAWDTPPVPEGKTIARRMELFGLLRKG